MNGTDTTQGILSQLLGGIDPAVRQQQMDRYRQAQQRQQAVLDEPLPDEGPISRMASDYLMRYSENPNQRFSSLAGAVGSETLRMRQQKLDELKRRELAAANETKNAGEELRMQDQFLKNALMGVRSIAGRGAGGGQTVKMDADGNMVVYDHLSGTSRVVHASQRGEYERLWQTAYKAAVEQGMSNPEEYAHSAASRVIGQTPSYNPQVEGRGQPAAAVPDTKPAGTEQQEGEIPKFSLRMDQLPVEGRNEVEGLLKTLNGKNKGEVERKLYEISQRYSQQQPETFPTATIAYRDKPRAAMSEAAAKGVGEAAAEDVKAVITAGSAAQEQWNAFNQLEKIDPYTNKFADVYRHAGEVLSALGQDSSSPIIQNAIKNREADQVLNQLRNASLKAEKGVQTASDEKRIAAELPKTTDLGAVFKFGVKLGKERAARKMEQGQFYQSASTEDPRSIPTLQSNWQKTYRDDPLTQYLGGKLIFRSDFLQAFKSKYPDATDEEAVSEWREMERDYQKRGGRK